MAIEFKQAHNFQNATRGVDDLERFCVHTAETTETGSAAEAVAGFFAAPTTTVSSHFVIDNNSIIQCVRIEDIAFHALGDNLQSIGLELAGKAGQGLKEWRDDYSDAVIANPAKLCGTLIREGRVKIPARWLTDEQIQDRVRGFETHKQVSDEFGEGIRSDPGRRFPYFRFMQLVQAEADAGQPVAIQFLLFDGDTKKKLAQSAPVKDQGAARRERLRDFLGAHIADMDAEMALDKAGDRDVVVRRRKAA